MILAASVSACMMLAAKSYHVSTSSIEGVLSVPAEVGGVGPMHIPASWLPILERVGFEPDQVEQDACTNIEAGTWILAFEAEHEAGRSTPVAPALPPATPDTDLSADACVDHAARVYHLPVSLLTAVLRTEGGHVGQIHQNANGSYDMGPAQINSIWLPVLARYGITRDMVLNDRCLNISVGAWILAQSLDGASTSNPAEFWEHVGDYNSHTAYWNRQYAMKVWNNVR